MGVQLTSISSTFFTNLLARLGVKPPPTDGFDLINTVQPVSIVDQDIVVNTATATPIFGLPFSTGRQTNPANGTVLADTGQLAGGNWIFFVLFGVSETQATELILQHRNAANGADIWDQSIFPMSGQGQIYLNRELSFAKTIVLNERMRAIVNNATGLTSVYEVNIFALQLS